MVVPAHCPLAVTCACVYQSHMTESRYTKYNDTCMYIKAVGSNLTNQVMDCISNLLVKVVKTVHMRARAHTHTTHITVQSCM